MEVRLDTAMIIVLTMDTVAIIAVIAWMLNAKSKRNWEKWQIKKDACFKALDIADAVLSNYEYQNVTKGDLTPQFESIENVRDCFNKLACTCDGPDVINELKKIMFEKIMPDAIIELRNAVRRELGLGKSNVDIDRAKAFVAKINCDLPERPNEPFKPTMEVHSNYGKN